MKKLLFIFAAGLCYIQASAQTSILQDKSGTSTFALGSNQFSLNAADASVSGNIFAGSSIGASSHYWDANFKFASTNGTSSLFDGTTFKPTFNVGGDYDFGNHNHSFYFGAKLNASYFSLLKSNGSNTFENEEFWGPTATAGYNLTGRLGKSPLLFGVSASYSRINDLSDLKSVDVYQSTAVTKNDTTLTALQGKKSGYNGNYQASNAMLVNVDAYVFPGLLHKQVGLGGYARLQMFGYKPRQDAGLGILFGKTAAASDINFGILYQFTDVFNQLGKQPDFIKRGGVNLVAGYKF